MRGELLKGEITAGEKIISTYPGFGTVGVKIGVSGCRMLTDGKVR